MKIISIAAVARNGVIGDDLRLPWHLPEDMRFFRSSTKGQTVLMGRRTFESLGKPLPNRENIVITRDLAWTAPGVRVFHDLVVAIETVRNEKNAENTGETQNIFVIGGAQIYAASLPFVDEIWLTEIQKDYPGNVVFPDYRDGEFRRNDFKAIERRPQSEDSPGTDRYFFVKYVRA